VAVTHRFGDRGTDFWRDADAEEDKAKIDQPDAEFSESAANNEETASTENKQNS